MLRPTSIIAAAALLTLVPMQYAAAQATSQIIYLSCDGTGDITNFAGLDTDNKKAVSNTGILVNLADSTVSSKIFGVVAHISAADDSHIEFKGHGPDGLGGSFWVVGDINRVTGSANITTSDDNLPGGGDPTSKLIAGEQYNLTCKVTNRLF
jgi:hypothetical protein